MEEGDGLAPMEEELDPGTDVIHHVPVDAMHPHLARGVHQTTVMHLGTQGGINPNRGAHQKSSKMVNVLTELRMQQTAPAFLEEVINTAEADKVEADEAGSFLSPGTGQKR